MSKNKRSKRVELMPIVYANAAGLDVGAREIYACIPPERAEEHVKVFGTFSADLNALADYLAAHHIDTVAMESTGLYTPAPMVRIGGDIAGFFRERDRADPKDKPEVRRIDLNPFDEGADDVAAGLKIGLMEPVLDFRRESFQTAQD